MMKRILIWAVISALMVSCSPSVTSEMLTHEFEALPTNKVMIYGAQDHVPDEARAIGKVTVDGRQASLKSQYARGLSLAVAETARNGGNVLVVDNSEIKDNRIKGTIAYMEGVMNKSLTLSDRRVKEMQNNAASRNVAVRQMDTAQQQAIVNQQEAARQQEIVQMQQAYWKRDSIANANWDGSFDWEEKHAHGGMVKISTGPVWTTSKIYLTEDASMYITDQRGYAISLSVTNTGGKIYGFGCDFYGSHTSIDTRALPGYVDCSYTLMYLGPCALIGGKITDWLRLDATLGLGMAYYQDKGQTEFGFGLRSSVGAEFLVTESAGIGIDLVDMTSYFKRPDGFQQPKDESYGIQHMGVMVTARFHL